MEKYKWDYSTSSICKNKKKIANLQDYSYLYNRTRHSNENVIMLLKLITNTLVLLITSQL